MEQIERIRRMEQTLDEATGAVQALARALEEYRAVLPRLCALVQYYEGEDWRRDFEADEDGLLPADLKRGVLSEDAVYDLLEENDDLMQQLRQLGRGE